MIRLKLNEYMDAHGITRYELSKHTGILFPVILIITTRIAPFAMTRTPRTASAMLLTVI